MTASSICVHERGISRPTHWHACNWKYVIRPSLGVKSLPASPSSPERQITAPTLSLIRVCPYQEMAQWTNPLAFRWGGAGARQPVTRSKISVHYISYSL